MCLFAAAGVSRSDCTLSARRVCGHANHTLPLYSTPSVYSARRSSTAAVITPPRRAVHELACRSITAATMNNWKYCAAPRFLWGKYFTESDDGADFASVKRLRLSEAPSTTGVRVQSRVVAMHSALTLFWVAYALLVFLCSSFRVCCRNVQRNITIANHIVWPNVDRFWWFFSDAIIKVIAVRFVCRAPLRLWRVRFQISWFNANVFSLSNKNTFWMDGFVSHGPALWDRWVRRQLS